MNTCGVASAVGLLSYELAGVAEIGKHGSLKSCCPSGLAGSSPAPGTILDTVALLATDDDDRRRLVTVNIYSWP